MHTGVGFIGIGKRKRRSAPQIITGSGPVLQVVLDGETVADALVSWGSYASADDPGNESVTREMNINSAGWEAYNGATVLAYDDTLFVRERVTDSIPTPERIFNSNGIMVDGTLASGSVTIANVSRTVTITAVDVAGTPTPSQEIIDFVATNDENDPLTLTGTGPWQVIVPDAFSETGISGSLRLSSVVGIVDLPFSIIVPSNATLPVAATAPTVSTTTPAPGQAVTYTPGTYTGTATITTQVTAFLDDVDVTANMVGNVYTIPLDATLGHVLEFVEIGVNAGGQSDPQSVTATVTAEPAASFDITLLSVGPQDPSTGHMPLSIEVATGRTTPLTAYLVFYPTGNAIPSRAQVVAGTDGGDVAATVVANFEFSTAGEFTLTDEIPDELNANYDFACVVKDADNLYSQVVQSIGVAINTITAIGTTLTRNMDGTVTVGPVQSPLPAFTLTRNMDGTVTVTEV